MNPYAQYLDGRDALAILAATPAELQSLIGDRTPEQMQTPLEAGKWSIREILAHLADCEIVWAFRIRQALETPGATVTPFDQDLWAAHYAAYTAREALGTFLSNRAWNLALLRAVSPAAWSNLLIHPERGTFTLSELLEMIAGHDLNHTTRLRERLR